MSQTPKIKREQLVPGARIEATAKPSLGAVFELIAHHQKGYNPQSGGSRSFEEYDFKLADDSPVIPDYRGTRTGFTLHYINRYFKLLPAV